MADKLKGKTVKTIIVAVAILAILITMFIAIKFIKTNNKWKDITDYRDIEISEKDSYEVKVEKLEKKIELLNGEIEKMQLELNPELEKLNALYKEYVSVLNENQPIAADQADTLKTNSEE